MDEEAVGSLERDALRELGAASEDPPPDLIPTFRLWHIPRNGLWMTWVLFIPDDLKPWSSEGVVRAVWWDRPEELARLPNEPSMEMKEAIVGPQDLHHLLGRASWVNLDYERIVHGPLSTSEFGIEGYRNRASYERVEWSMPIPPGMRAIMAWYSKARGILERRLSASP